MAPQAIAGLANIGISALPLFFGENSIFSKKARTATRELEKNFRASQNMQLPGEYTEAMQNLRTQANVGIPGAALGLYQQQAGRQQASQLAALGSRRSALGGIGQIAQAGQDASLRLAGMQSQALQQGQSALTSGLMQMGGIQRQEALRKQQEAADYWGTRKAEANAAVSNALSAVGSAAGMALATGAFNKSGVDSVDNSQSTVNPKLLQRARAKMAESLSTFRPPAPNFNTEMPDISAYNFSRPTFNNNYDFGGGLSNIFSAPRLNYNPRGLRKK